MSTTAAAVNAERMRRVSQKSGNVKRVYAEAPSSSHPAAVHPEKQLTRSTTMSRLSWRASHRVSPTDTAKQTGAVTSTLDTVEMARRNKRQLLMMGDLRGASRMQRFMVWWVIDPRHTRCLGYWDLVTVLCLFFVAIVTPFGTRRLSSLVHTKARERLRNAPVLRRPHPCRPPPCCPHAAAVLSHLDPPLHTL
jgi:hypothetical protein